MKALIMVGVIILFVAIVIWRVGRASKNEDGCCCEEGCPGHCDDNERKR
jgi:hypothetical protein